MPSRQNITQRRKAAHAAMNEALTVIADRLGIAVAPVDASGPAARDPEFRDVLQSEQAVAILTQIADTLADMPMVEVLPGCDGCDCDGVCTKDDPEPTDADTTVVVDESGTQIGSATRTAKRSTKR